MKELQRLLGAAREALGRTQSDVAAATATSSRTIWRAEQYVGVTRIETLAKLRDYYEAEGVSIVRIATGRDEWELVFSETLAPSVAPIGGIFLAPPPPLLRAARGMLGLTQIELSEKAGIAHTTLRRVEQAASDVEPDTILKFVSKLKEFGVEFVEPHVDGRWHLYLRDAESGGG